MLYSDVIMNYSKALQADKKIEYYKNLYETSLNKEIKTQYQLYCYELKLHIMPKIHNDIIEKLNQARMMGVEQLSLPTNYKYLQSMVSYFFEKKLPACIPSHISKMISINLLAKLSTNDLTSVYIVKQIPQELNSIFKLNKGKKIVFSDINEFNGLLHDINYIVDEILDSIEDILFLYESEIIHIVEGYILDVAHETIKNDLSINP